MLPENSSSKNAVVERIARWSARRRGLAIVLWLGLVALSVLAAALVPGRDAPNTDAGEAGQAQEVLRSQGTPEPIRENVLIQPHDPLARFADPEPRAALDDLLTALRGTAVAEVRSPLDDTLLVSGDGRSGLVPFQVTGQADAVKTTFTAVRAAVDDVAERHPTVRVVQAGDRSLSSAVDEHITADLERSHLLSLPITLLVLVVVFGSLVAAAVPLVLTVTVVATAFALLQLIGKVVPINSAASAMILLVGVAVGVDYSLFSLRRHREELAAGHGVADSLATTARTSGRVVAVSGLTVVLCLSGLLFTGLGVFRGLTIGIVLVVALAVVASVTVLPALLAALGPRIGRGRPHPSRTWSAVARAVVRRPLVWGGVATLALVVVALPAFGMRLQDPAATQSLPRSVPAVDAAIRMGEAFPGAPTPARVVLWDPSGAPVDRPDVRAAIEDFRSHAGVLVAVVPVGHALVLRVPLPGAGTDDRSTEALEALRAKALPAAFGHLDGVAHAVGGRTATPHDFATRLAGRAPVVVAFVLVLAFLLLARTFRSPAIALISIALNLLSLAAAYGVTTWVFQDGHLAVLLGFTPYGGVVGWLPLFMFVILFGLSMDYHLFVLSRIRERRLAGAADAVVDGIATSAGVVTSAAVVMTVVFAVFVTLTAVEYKMLGVGMAFAVVVDATVVRGVLLPAALALLGNRAWPPPVTRSPRTSRSPASARAEPGWSSPPGSSTP